MRKGFGVMDMKATLYERDVQEHILKHIMNTIHTAVRVYDEEGGLVHYYGERKEDDVLLEDTELLNKLINLVDESYPLIYQDFYPIYFMVIKHKKFIYIIGVVTCDYTVEKINGIRIGKYFSGIHHMKKETYKFNYCEFAHFCKEGLLFFNVLKNIGMTFQQLIDNNNHMDGIGVKLKHELNQIYFRYQENEKLHNPYDQEVRELNSIREGDVDKLKKSLEEEFEGDYATLSREPLRSVKNLAIVTLALTARAAIDGGLLPEESFSINDSYILQVDTASNLPQVLAIATNAKLKYARLVKERRTSLKLNRIVEEAKNLIYKNMHSKIVIKEIAEKLSITPQYLSALFKRTEGISMNEYIMTKKIGLAENLLIYSNYSSEEISYFLGFCSQSHFGGIFKRIKGMTPKKYRERYGVRGFMDDI